MEKLLQIKSSYFTAGVVLVNDVVTKAPSIVKYMNGWPYIAVRKYCSEKKWKLSEVRNDGTEIPIIL